MFQTEIIRNAADAEKWIAARRLHDLDFDHTLDRVPCLVLWIDGTSNGYPDVSFSEIDLAQARRIVEQLSPPPAADDRREPTREEWQRPPR